MNLVGAESGSSHQADVSIVGFFVAADDFDLRALVTVRHAVSLAKAGFGQPLRPDLDPMVSWWLVRAHPLQLTLSREELIHMVFGGVIGLLCLFGASRERDSQPRHAS